MFFRRVKIIGLVGLLWSNACVAQLHMIKTYNSVDGLGASEIYDIHQDRKGYLWIATYGGGISRYDGICFTHFGAESGLGDEKVLKILEDNKGYLWFGTYGGGVCRFDGATFTTFSTKDGLAGNIVSDLAEDKDGNLWLACPGAGISKYNGDRFVNYPDAPGARLNTVLCLETDSSGRLWIGRSESGVVLLEDNKFSLIKHSTALSHIVWDIYEDRSGRMWFGTYGGGVSCFNGKSFVNYRSKDGLSNDIVYSVFEDAQGRIWVGTDSHGIDIINDNEISNISESNGLSHNRVRCITSDTEGNIWIGTEAGVNKYSGKAFVTYEAVNSILSVFQDKQGNIWTGTFNEGVKVFAFSDNNAGEFKTIRTFNNSNGLPGNRVWKILGDKKGRVWLGTANGLCIYDGKHLSIPGTSYAKLRSSTYALLEDREGRMWIGNDNGLHVFTSDSVKSYSVEDGLSHNRVRSLAEDGYGNIWIGTYSGGVTKFDGERFIPVTECEALRDAIVYDIRLDKKGAIWFATYGKGVTRYDNEKQKYNTFTVNDGLASNAVFVLQQDQLGDIWIGNTRGLDKLDMKAFEAGKVIFSHYGPEEGFAGIECNQGACFKGANGNLWFGTKVGLVKCDPAEDWICSTEPRIHLKEVKLFFEKVNWETYAEIDKYTRLPINLVLPYDKNHLTFEFTGISFTSSTRVAYRFRLKGFDKDWTPETHLSHAVYSNLPPGTYTFEVMARNSSGIWNSKPASFTFTLLPPIWNTPFAYTLFGVVIVAFFYMVIKLRTRYLEGEKGRLIAEIAKRKEVETKLKAVNTELQTFMYKASHDIRGPLSSTIGLINVARMEKGGGNPDTYFELIDKSVKRLDSILLNTLEVARIKIQQPQKIKIDFEKIVSDILLPYVPGTVPVKFEVDIKNTREFYGDPFMLDSIIRNVIDNSIKYRDPGRNDGFVKIAINDTEQGIDIIISDNGTGISKEALPYVYDMFYRGTENSQGIGLGLYMVRNAVLQLGGTIKIESETGAGTVITISLPSHTG